MKPTAVVLTTNALSLALDSCFAILLQPFAFWVHVLTLELWAAADAKGAALPKYPGPYNPITELILHDPMSAEGANWIHK